MLANVHLPSRTAVPWASWARSGEERWSNVDHLEYHLDGHVVDFMDTDITTWSIDMYRWSKIGMYPFRFRILFHDILP